MSSKKEQAAELRRQAEEKFQTLEPSAVTTLPKDEVEKLFHELRVHQIEMEMQNDELRRIQGELELARSRYFDLYDLAPAGYLTLSEQGLILESNLTAVNLLGVPRSTLVKRPFTQFILKEDQDIYYLHRKKLFETGEPQQCEMRLLKSDGEFFWALVDATAAQDTDGAPVCRVILSDITESKQTEISLAESEKKSRVWLTNSPICTKILDLDFNLQYMSEAGVTALKVDDVTQLYGKPYPFSFYPDSFNKQMIGNLEKAKATGKTVTQEAAVVDLEGRELWFHSTIVPIKDEQDQLAYLMVISMETTERKQAEKALQVSEKRFKNVAESMSDWVWEVNADGIYTFSSSNIKTTLGYQETEILGKTPFDFMPADEAKRVGALFGEIVRDKRRFHGLENWNLTKDGRRICLLTSGTPIFGNAGEFLGYRGVDTDITERKKTEELLVKNEIKQAKMVANIGDVIVIFDQDGINRYKSPNIYNWLGWKPEEVVGCGALDNVHPDDVDRARELIGDLMSEPNRTGAFECRYRCKDGTYKWIEFAAINLLQDPDIQGILGNYHDITERKRAEAEKERLMAAINQSAEIVVITDPEGVIEYVNPAFNEITGYTREEAIGQTPRILKSGEQDDAFYQQLWGTLLRGETWIGQFVNKKKDGTFYTEEATISPVKDGFGKVVNYVGVKRDITVEIKQENQIRQSQKMQAVGQLVGGVAHDFNNLVHIIKGYTELALMKLEPGHAAGASLEAVSKAGEQAKNLVGQLLAFSRQQVIAPVSFDLNEEIELEQKMLGRLIGEHIQLEFVAGKDLGQVFADKGQINQVLMNLCVNARDAMPDGGTLTIETKELSFAPEDMATCGFPRPGRYVLLSVTDTGCGMDKPIREKIFTPFFTTKEVGKGTGLGLSTVYGIIEQNKGHITVYSEPGLGTTFKIYLPVSTLLTADVISSISEKSAPAESGVETILVAEDDESLLRLATQILSDAGYTVLTAKDGEEAVRVFEEHADQIDLVMMDVVMPRMGGKEAIKRILEKRPALRYLFASGYNPDAGHNEFIKEKGLHLLNKPYPSAVLLSKIREVLNETREMDAVAPTKQTESEGFK
jgi:PAS domain S-box-containing protein